MSWMDRVTNEEITRRMSKETAIRNNQKTRKLPYLSHVMGEERYHMLQLIMQGKNTGEENRGTKTHFVTEQFERMVPMVRVGVIITSLLKGYDT